MYIRPRRQIAQAGEIVHGAVDADELARLGLNPQDLLDVSANTNPFGPAPRVRASLADVAIGEYPDRQATKLRTALADRWQVSHERLLVGNGATELIWLAALAYLDRGDQVLILGPTFGEYRRASLLMGAEVRELAGRAADGFRLHPAEFSELLATLRPKLAFVCQPNNPTGQLWPWVDLEHCIRNHPATLFIVDEAYLDFLTEPPSAVALAADNVVVLRSMTKFYGLAGLRLGYALACPQVIASLAHARPPWSVNAAAQQAGLAALADESYAADCLVRLRSAKNELVAALEADGFAPLPSVTPYFLLPVDDGARVRGALLRKKILVRDTASFGLPGFIRISTPRPQHIGRLLTCLREVC